MVFRVYGAFPPADPCEQTFFQQEFSTEREALEYALASRKAAIEAGKQSEQYCIKTTDGEIVLNSKQIIYAFNNKESGWNYPYR